jgi:hypothetical protein
MIDECEYGKRPDFENCECVDACPSTECHREGFTMDLKTCKCIEDERCEKACAPGFTLDDRSCECVANCNDLTCGEGTHPNFEECRCDEIEHECGDVPNCPPFSRFDFKRCLCVDNDKPCEQVCPEFLGLVLDHEKCECMSAYDCPKKEDDTYCTREGFYFSCIKDKCMPMGECDIEQCPVGQYLD